MNPSRLSPYAGSHFSREIVGREEKNQSDLNNSVESKASDTASPSFLPAASLKRNQRLPHFIPLPSSSLHTGVSIGGENIQPGTDTDPMVTKFIEQTLQNVTYDSPDHLQRRAENFFRYLPAEREINAQSRNAMSKSDSPIAKQSAHLAHLVRGIWAKAELDPAIREQLKKEMLDQNNESESSFLKGVNIFEKDLNAMFAYAEAGPLTFKQSQFGAEVSYVLRRLARKLTPHSDLISKFYSYGRRVNVDPDRAGTHHMLDAHGANLSSDLGSKFRDELGLPVMLGTSGSGSNVAATAKFASNHQGVSLWADGLTEDQGRMAIIDAVFHHMREQVVPIAMKPKYDAMRVKNGVKPKTVDPFMIFTHSYPEVSSAVEMTLNEENGKDEFAMRRTSDRAQQRLNWFLDNKNFPAVHRPAGRRLT